MSEEQLACLAIAAGPMLVSLMFAIGNTVAFGAGPPPSPKRVLRLCLAGPFFALAWAVVALLELADDVNILLHAIARRAFLGLRSWMAA